MNKEQFYTRKISGEKIDPGDGIVPIMRKRKQNEFDIIGTGFYITRYGLFMSASHVLEEMIDEESNTLQIGYVVHLAQGSKIHLRKIIVSHRNEASDVAACQADNFMEKFPLNPLINLRPRISFAIPKIGSRLVTYAYPENEILRFGIPDESPTIKGDYFDGKFLRHVRDPENPSMPFPYYETTIRLGGGASGGPVFDENNCIIGINCRGWDFGESSEDDDNLSYIIPIAEALSIRLSHLQIPKNSWEMKQLPKGKLEKGITFAELTLYGHIGVEY